MSAEQDSSRGDTAPNGRGDDCHYDSYYYEHCCGMPYDRNEEWLRVFRRFADRIVSEIAPESVLDAGCAMGLLVEALADRGVEAHGVDISAYAISRVPESVAERCRVGSIVEPFGRRYDLIVSIEVLEHLQREEAERAVENFCAHADDIILSTSPFDYKEASHFNVEPPEYWARLFARHGFFRDLDYDASYITRWATRFRKAKKTATRLVTEYERRLWRLLQENLGARESLMEHQEKLVLSEMALAQARERNGHLEAASRDFEAKLVERFAREAAISRDFHRTVEAWSLHVKNLEASLRDWEALHVTLLGEIETRGTHLVEFQRLLDEARVDLAARAPIEDELAKIHASGAWRLANRLTSLRASLFPEGSRRHRLAQAVTGWRSLRRDAAQPPSPAFARTTESESLAASNRTTSR